MPWSNPPLILNSVALLVALLSTAISSVSATRMGKNHFSASCRLFEPTGCHKFIITLSLCHAAVTSKSLHPNHTNFQFLLSSSPHYLFIYLCLSHTANMSKDQYINIFDQPAGRRRRRRPGEPAGSLSVAMPGPAGILLMKTLPAQMYALWWPGQWPGPSCLEKQGWCHQHLICN